MKLLGVGAMLLAATMSSCYVYERQVERRSVLVNVVKDLDWVLQKPRTVAATDHSPHMKTDLTVTFDVQSYEIRPGHVVFRFCDQNEDRNRGELVCRQQYDKIYISVRKKYTECWETPVEYSSPSGCSCNYGGDSTYIKKRETFCARFGTKQVLPPAVDLGGIIAEKYTHCQTKVCQKY